MSDIFASGGARCRELHSSAKVGRTGVTREQGLAVSSAPIRLATQSAGAATAQQFNDARARIHFDGQVGGAAYPSLSRAQQNEFATDFCRELARLKRWAAALHWLPCDAGELQVIVSDKFRISKSLVPAWYGRAGHMEFPARRVIARKAAIAHELTHIFFPNGSRFLAEGLAVYLQAEIGGNPAFPNFGRPLHELACELLQKMVPEFTPGKSNGLDKIRIAGLDEIATPAPLELEVGEDFYGEGPRGQAHLYPVAGSFIQFLIDAHGMERFRTLYMRTPLVPLQQNAGPPARWMDVYGVSLAALEAEWKTLIAGGAER
jgi:hypothetical protein